MRKARSEVKGLPAGFRYHDLRHYLASLQTANGPTSRSSWLGYVTVRPRPR